MKFDLFTHLCMCISKAKTQLIVQRCTISKMMQYEIKLSTKHPSETNNNFENSYLKSIIIFSKNRFFYNIPIRIEIFCNQHSIGLKYFADIWFSKFLIQLDRQK